MSQEQEEKVTGDKGEVPAVPVFHQRLSEEGALHVLDPVHSGLLYHADDKPTVKPMPDLPDEFYEPQPGDVDSLWRGLQEKRRSLDDAPLLTSKFRNAARDSETLRNLNQHPVAVIRVRFPNRYVLQARFNSIDTVQAVVDYVGTVLEDPHLPFYLFTAPPRRPITADHTTLTTRLVELGLVSGSVIYFGTHSTGTDYIRANLIREKLSCPQAVGEWGKGPARGKPRLEGVSMETGEGEEGRTGTPAGSSKGGRTGGPSGSGSNIVPKWFKQGKK